METIYSGLIATLWQMVRAKPYRLYTTTDRAVRLGTVIPADVQEVLRVH